jgi:hypothetical protein
MSKTLKMKPARFEAFGRAVFSLVWTWPYYVDERLISGIRTPRLKRSKTLIQKRVVCNHNLTRPILQTSVAYNARATPPRLQLTSQHFSNI